MLVGNGSVVAVLQLLNWAVASMDPTVVTMTRHHQTTLSPLFISHWVAVQPISHLSCGAIKIHLNIYRY